LAHNVGSSSDTKIICIVVSHLISVYFFRSTSWMSCIACHWCIGICKYTNILEVAYSSLWESLVVCPLSRCRFLTRIWYLLCIMFMFWTSNTAVTCGVN